MIQLVLSIKEIENVVLFEQLNDYVLAEKLFLIPNLSRDYLSRMIGVEKNRFAKIIRQNTGTNLWGYINNLRLDYAVKLMKEHPQYIIYTISVECGFPNVRTFYRLFQNRFGVSPSVYKRVL